MSLTAQQTQQLALILSCTFEELRNRSRDPAAVADLAYASHNLPFLGLNDHHSLASLRGQFERYHQDHGYFLFDFLAMLDTLTADGAPHASYPQ